MLTKEQKNRYNRQLILKEIGESGQERLLNSKVLVIGSGGLGSASLYYLAAAGVGNIGIVDFDIIEISNLQRQILHDTTNIGKEKIISAKEKLKKLNPDINIITYNEKFNKINAKEIIKNYDFIIDATDNFDSKFLINDICVENKKPYSHAGVKEFEGQTFTYIPEHTCYRCIFKTPPKKNEVIKGILGAVAGTIGTIQATEAIKYLLNIGNLLVDELLIYNSLKMQFRKVKLNKSISCPICNK